MPHDDPRQRADDAMNATLRDLYQRRVLHRYPDGTDERVDEVQSKLPRGMDGGAREMPPTPTRIDPGEWLRQGAEEAKERGDSPGLVIIPGGAR